MRAIIVIDALIASDMFVHASSAFEFVLINEYFVEQEF